MAKTRQQWAAIWMKARGTYGYEKEAPGLMAIRREYRTGRDEGGPEPIGELLVPVKNAGKSLISGSISGARWVGSDVLIPIGKTTGKAAGSLLSKAFIEEVDPHTARDIKRLEKEQHEQTVTDIKEAMKKSPFSLNQALLDKEARERATGEKSTLAYPVRYVVGNKAYSRSFYSPGHAREFQRSLAENKDVVAVEVLEPTIIPHVPIGRRLLEEYVGSPLSNVKRRVVPQFFQR